MSDRNASKKRRAAQNKAARDALAARRTKAAAAQDRRSSETQESDGADRAGRASRPASARRRSPLRRRGSGDDATVTRPSRTAGSSPARSSAERPAREPTARPRREPKTRLGRTWVSIQEVPGGRAVLFGFLFSIVAAGMLLLAPITPREVLNVPRRIIVQERVDSGKPVSAADRKALKEGDPLEDPRVESTYLTTLIGPAAVVVVVPVLIAGAAVALARRPGRARTFLFAAIAQMLFVFLLAALGIFFLFSAGGLGFGAYKARKAEGPSPRRSWRRPAAGAEDQGDVEEVEEEPSSRDPDDDRVR